MKGVYCEQEKFGGGWRFSDLEYTTGNSQLRTETTKLLVEEMINGITVLGITKEGEKRGKRVERIQNFIGANGRHKQAHFPAGSRRFDSWLLSFDMKTIRIFRLTLKRSILIVCTSDDAGQMSNLFISARKTIRSILRTRKTQRRMAS